MSTIIKRLIRSLFAASSLFACGDRHAPVAAPAQGSAAGLATFEIVRQVLLPPRCQNCHPAGDALFKATTAR